MIKSDGVARDLLKKSGIQEVLDLDITEVAINQCGKIFFDRGNGWESKIEERCNFDICKRLAVALSVLSNSLKPISASNPIASVILPGGERGQVIIPPAVEDNCISFTFRKPSTTRFELSDYTNSGRFSSYLDSSNSLEKNNKINEELKKLKDEKKIEEFFKLAVTSNKNILIVGGTGSGKTTVMKALVDLYPKNERIFTIEDVHEIDLPKHSNHVHLFYSESGLTPQRIIESCMRMKPDHILLAELRGAESFYFLEALNTGHGGAITTIHANDCISAFSRLADLVKQSDIGKTLDYDYILNMVKKSIDVVCFFKNTYLKELYFNK